jgi:hypothetical protein
MIRYRIKDLRRLGAAVRDRRFDLRSPIPLLTPEQLSGLGADWVKMPPLRDFDHGNQSPLGLLWLTSIAAAVGVETAFEIGSYNGLTALTLALNLPTATIHTLDLGPTDEPALPLFRYDPVHIVERRSRLYEGSDAGDRIVQHLGDSATFDFSPYYGRCQLVYVDGAHSFDYVQNDSEQAFRLVSSDGVVIWDDYWYLVPDVPRYLDGLDRRGLYRVPGTRLVVLLPAD